MSFAAAALGVAGIFGLVGSCTAFVLGPRHRVVAANLCTVVVGGAASIAAIRVLTTGEHIMVRWADVLPLAGVTIDLGPLGAWFVLAAGLVIVASAVYAIGYCDHALAARAVQGMFPLFATSLVLVPAAASVSTFLALWELMAMTSLVLVAAEHRERDAVRSATVWYGIMTQVGFVAVLAALCLAAAGAGSERSRRSGPARTGFRRLGRRSSSCWQWSGSGRRRAPCRRTCGCPVRIRRRRVMFPH